MGGQRVACADPSVVSSDEGGLAAWRDSPHRLESDGVRCGVQGGGLFSRCEWEVLGVSDRRAPGAPKDESPFLPLK